MDNHAHHLLLMTLEDVAELLKVSKRTVERLIRRKELLAFKVGSQWRINESQIRQWFERLQSESERLRRSA